MGKHTRSTQFHHPVGSKAPTEHLQDFGRINACLGSEHQGLANRFDHQGNDDLITGLDLACSTSSNVYNRSCRSLEDGHTAPERIVVSAHHNGERAGNCALITTAHRRVEHSDAPVQPADQLTHSSPQGNGAHIDDDQSRMRSLDNTARTHQHLFNLSRAGQHGDHHIARGSDISRVGYQHPPREIRPSLLDGGSVQPAESPP